MSVSTSEDMTSTYIGNSKILAFRFRESIGAMGSRSLQFKDSDFGIRASSRRADTPSQRVGFRNSGFGLPIIPERIKIIPLQGIAPENGFQLLSEPRGAIPQANLAFGAAGHLRTLGRKGKEVIMTAWFADIKYMHQGRTRNGRHYERADREGSRAPEKGDPPRGAAIRPATRHSNTLPPPEPVPHL